MTFTEAAIEVLRREGKPLHFKKIAEIAVRESLLDHVGKVPEETLADQLAAHCRLPRTERRVAPVQAGTFALVEWGLEEDPAGLEALVEPPPEQELLYRGRERHPVPSRELARTAGRGEGGRARRRDDEERRGRRFPPPAEVAYEILAGAGRPLNVAEIAAQGAERLLMPDAFVRDTASLDSALLEDNRRREASGRKPLFQIEGDVVTLVAQPEPGERVAAPAVAARAPASPLDVRLAALAALRRRLRECDGPTVEHVVGKLLEKLGFREVKVAKRGREHVIYTARKRMGLGDVRHAIRIVRSGGDAGRRDVTDLRRDVGHYGAQLGIVVTSGDAGREARSEAASAGQLPIVLLCGEAFAEALADAGVGCVPIVVPEVDEAFFKTAVEAAGREEAARKARREERDEREKRERPRREERADGSRREDRADREARREARAAQAAAVGARDEDVAITASVESIRAPLAGVVEVPAYRVLPGADEADEDGDEDGPEDGSDEEGAEGEPLAGATGSEGGEGASAEGGAAGERRRRRRRRRRRGGRGRGREGAAGEGEPATTPGALAVEATGEERSGESADTLPAPAGKAPGSEVPEAAPAANGEESSR
jgi:ribonuclease E